MIKIFFKSGRELEIDEPFFFYDRPDYYHIETRSGILYDIPNTSVDYVKRDKK